MPYRDPVASLVSVPIEFKLLGKIFTVPAMMAAGWLELLMTDRMTMFDIVPGLLPDEDVDEIDLAMLEGILEAEEVVKMAEEVLAVASGRDWWFTVRLIGVAKASWDAIGGEMAKAPVSPERMTFGAWIDLAYLTMRLAIANGGDPKQAQMRLTKFVADLEMSPTNPGEEMDEEAEAEAFLRAMQMAG